MPRGTLEVILISAKKLHNSDFFGAGSEPRWNESFLFTVSGSVSELNLRLMDKDTFTSDDFLGETKINLEPVLAVGSIPETCYNVVKDQNYCGEIKVALIFNPEW
ncbi:unnamed protein product [Sphenostylis stenocarpa]|uniref:C2 domain-containing protein n=1 Tax=Sphenostylis stenocarpa TaxID=92480 RepID=A0AA86V5G5_9FABA|nr:unnamed protein product [Sphenostylis stenocarpa]